VSASIHLYLRPRRRRLANMNSAGRSGTSGTEATLINRPVDGAAASSGWQGPVGQIDASVGHPSQGGVP
jgi:hypothetical protein